MELIVSEAEPQRIDVLNDTYVYEQKNMSFGTVHMQNSEGCHIWDTASSTRSGLAYRYPRCGVRCITNCIFEFNFYEPLQISTTHACNTHRSPLPVA
jgi:hypothetical protein